MAIIIDGEDVHVQNKDGGKELGPDEKMLLDALHGRGPLGEKLKRDLEKEKNKAKYKIEIHFGKGRTHNLTEPNKALVMVWESGRRFHGGGDQLMYYCGYSQAAGFQGEDVCGIPIEDKYFGINHLVCPHCRRENFLDPMTKQRHLEVAVQEGQSNAQIEQLNRIPVIASEKFVNMTPKNMAAFLAKIWHQLKGNAEFSCKYHPTDIRCYDVADPTQKAKGYEKARRDRMERKENRGRLVYTLESISKDIAAGATLEGRILAMLRA